jgi:HEAT repeats
MPDLGAAVVQLGNPDTRHDAAQLLLDAGAAAIPALREGLTHPYWRVRHMSCRLLDDLLLDADLLGELRSLALTDPNKRVRHQAWHAVTCEPCKPDGLDLSFEVAPLYAIADQLRDRSLRVRRGGGLPASSSQRSRLTQTSIAPMNSSNGCSEPRPMRRS